MEEFFNKSLEQFDNSPSDNVWENLAERMESEETFLQRWEHKLRRYLPLLLLLLSFGVYFGYAQGKLNALQMQMSSMVEENLALRGNLVACGERQKQEQEDGKANGIVVEEGSDNETPIGSTSIELNGAEYPNKKELIKDFTVSNKAELANRSLLREEQNNNAIALNSVDNLASAAVDKEPIVTPNEPVPPLPKVTTKPPTAIQPIDQKTPFAFVSPQTYISLGVVYVKPINQPDLPGKANYRIGYTARLFNTLTSVGRPLNFGFSTGVRQELKLFGAWSLTNAVRFNQQTYRVDNGNDFISPADLRKYPAGQEQSEQIRAIDIKSNYFDIPVGLKFTFGHTKKGFRYYVNPSATWLVYLPQNFSYTLSSGAKVEQKNKRYYGYFGTGNLEVGLEKRLRNNLFWQVGAWGERSFIPLGIEDQKITMFGLSTSLLFGK